MSTQGSKDQSLSKDAKQETSANKVKEINKEGISKAEYVYELPEWNLMPPAAFVARRVHKK